MIVAIQAENDLRSLAALSGELQVPARTIEDTLLRLRLVPVLRLNSILYLDHQQAEQVAQAIRNQK